MHRTQVALNIVLIQFRFHYFLLSCDQEKCLIQTTVKRMDGECMTFILKVIVYIKLIKIKVFVLEMPICKLLNILKHCETLLTDFFMVLILFYIELF